MHLIVDICVALENNTMFSAQSLNEKKKSMDISTDESCWFRNNRSSEGYLYVPDICLTKSTWENGFNLVPPLFREHCVQLL